MKEVITNRDVLNAINACLDTRWIPAAKDPYGQFPDGHPSCQLCKILYCSSCPIAIYNKDETCGLRGSTHDQWRRSWSGRKEAAVQMRDLLLKVRKHFFGE
jgi:hypothetical protein